MLTVMKDYYGGKLSLWAKLYNRAWMNPELSSLFMKELSMMFSTRTSEILG